MSRKILSLVLLAALIFYFGFNVFADETPSEDQSSQDVEDSSAGGEQAQGSEEAIEEPGGGSMMMSTTTGSQPYTSSEKFQVEPSTGTAGLTIPIDVPRGRKGIQPNFTLAYNSSSGNSILGVGWSLELGSIQRSTKRGIPKYDGSDTFVLVQAGSTQELVNISGNEYRAKIEGAFMKIEYYGSTGWLVTDKKGIKYYFGQNAESQQVDSSRIFKWCLDRVEDLNGNYMTIIYFKDQNQIYPHHIYYTGNSTTVDSPFADIEFVLEDRGRDNLSYRTGFPVTTDKRLKEVIVKVDSQLQRRYELNYQSSPSTQRCLLTSITQYGANGTSLPSTTFDYQAQGDSFVETTDWIVPSLSGAGFTDGDSITDNGVRLMDVNADGLVDIVQADGYNEFETWLNTGSGFEQVEQGSPFILPPFQGGDGFTEGEDGSEDNGVRLADINGDGLIDLIQADKSNERGAWLNTGSGFVESTDWVVPVIDSGGFTENDGWHDNGVRLADINGDGLIDILQADRSDERGTWLNDAETFDLLVEIDNGLGGITQITYIPSTQYQNTFLPFPVQTVSQVTVTDEVSGQSYTTSYEYSDGYWVGYPHREFRGFGYAKITDTEGNYAETYFLQDEFNKGRIDRQESYDSLGNPYAKVVNDWQEQDLGGGCRFVYLNKADNFIFNGDSSGRRTQAQSTYDSYGNVIQTIEFGEVDFDTGSDIGTDMRTAFTEYTYNTTDWLVSLPKTAYVQDYNVTIVKQAWFYYDGNASPDDPPTQGLLTKQEDWLDGGDNPATQFTYDDRGNLLTSTDALNHTTTITYDETYHLFPVITENVLEHRVTNEYYGVDGVPLDDGTYHGLWGQTKSSTDPNESTSYSIYDTFGRTQMQISPEDSVSYPTASYEYDLSSIPVKIISHQREVSGQSATLDSVSFYDSLGRAVQAKTESEESDKFIVSGQVEFNSRGLPEKKYLPFFSTNPIDSFESINPSNPHATITYDPMGRAIQSTNPDGAYATVEYDDWMTTTIDENGHKQKSYFDAFGRLIQKEEYIGADGRSPHYPQTSYVLYATTVYTYDTLGNLIQTQDAHGNTTTITYDTLSRKTSMSDPDMGDWTYTYDTLGNLFSQTDSKGQLIEFDYDSVNRLTEKTGPATQQVTYTYDDPAIPNSKGRLTDASYTQVGNTKFYYDALGREIQSEKTIDSIQYTIQRTYDTAGRLTSVTYPDGQQEAFYIYNSSGAVESITNTSITGDDNILTNASFEDWAGGPDNPPDGWGISPEMTIARATDITDSYTKLLLHCNGEDGSTAFIDSSPYDHTVSANGDAQIDTAQYKFAGASGLFDGSGDFLEIPDSDDWNFGAGDFTMDFWVRFNDTDSENYFYNQYTGPSDNVRFSLSPTNNLIFRSKSSGEEQAYYYYNWTYSTGVWHHIALVRNGSNLYLFIDGDSKTWTDIYTAINTNTLPDVSAELKIGEYLNGWIDELRVSKGVARWTSNFTPPADGYEGHIDGSYSARITGGESFPIELRQEIPDYESYKGRTLNYSCWVYADEASRVRLRLFDGVNSHFSEFHTGSSSWEELSVVDSISDSATELAASISIEPGGTISAYCDAAELTEEGSVELQYYVTNVDYNASGQITKIEYGNGDVTDYTYDPQMLRLVNLRTQNSELLTLQDLSYQYDSVGNIISITDAVNSGSQTFSYDALNRLISASGNAYGTKNYTYDEIGNMTFKDGTTYNYGEGDTGPHAVTSGSDGSVFEYDLNGNMISWTTAGGIVSEYEFDSENRLTKVNIHAQSKATFEYDGDGGRQKKIIHTHTGGGGCFLSGTPILMADGSTRPIEEVNVGDKVLSFDTQDSRVVMGTVKNTFNHHNKTKEYLIIDDELRVTSNHQFYSQGSWQEIGSLKAGDGLLNSQLLEEKIQKIETVKLDEPVSLYNLEIDTYQNYFAGGVLAHNKNLYYLLQHRVGGGGVKLNLRTIKRYVFDFLSSLFEVPDAEAAVIDTPTIYVGSLYEKTNSIPTKHIFLGSMRIASIKGGEVSYYHTNHLGSTDIITDSLGEEVVHYEYAPYGEVVATEGEDATKYKFTGKPLDDETGLYYYGARYYNPFIGRFITPDSIVQAPDNPQTLNRYAYCGNNPVRYIDPKGQSFWDWAGTLFGLIGGVAKGIFTGDWSTLQAQVTTLASAFVLSGGNLVVTAAAFLAMNILDTPPGRKTVNWVSNEIFDDAFGMRPRAAYIVGNMVTHAVVASAIYIGLESLDASYNGPDYAKPENQAEISKYGIEGGDKQPGGSTANYIADQMAKGKAPKGLTDWYQQGRVSSDIAFKDTPVLGKAFEALNVRHAAAVVNKGGTLFDSAKNISLNNLLKGQVYASPWTATSHQAFFGTLVQSGMSGTQALSAATSQAGWSFYLTSSIYGVEGHFGAVGIVNAEVNRK